MEKILWALILLSVVGLTKPNVDVVSSTTLCWSQECTTPIKEKVFTEETLEDIVQHRIEKSDVERFEDERDALNLVSSGDQLKYIARFHPTARKEQIRYGIPYSIKMAQGLLESGAGESKLATRANNHFGIKSTNGVGYNLHDDDPDDMFVIYKSSWESWRAHSLFLTRPDSRYNLLFKKKFRRADYEKYRNLRGLNYPSKTRGRDPRFDWKVSQIERYWNVPYKRWAYTLDVVGYATSNRYAESLISMIEKIGLNHYDE